VLALVLLVTAPSIAAPSDAFGSDDPAAIESAVARVEHAPADPDVLLEAARACEATLHAPARALALYERIEREAPDARAAATAGKRAIVLRGELGDRGEFAAQASALASLIANGDQLPASELLRKADELAAQPWPGAADAALFAAEWLRARDDFDAARARYQHVQAHWPGSPQAIDAARAAAGCAIDARDWTLAEQLARDLPARDALEAAARSELLGMAARGRARDRLCSIAWIVLAIALVALLVSLLEAASRGGWTTPRVRPPFEVMFFAPIAAALVVVAIAAQRVIAPAVGRIAVVGLIFAYLSGATLDLLQRRGRRYRARAIAHVVVCLAGVLAIAYIALDHDGLIELLASTFRDGPEG
jgi:hypothetical protein